MTRFIRAAAPALAFAMSIGFSGLASAKDDTAKQDAKPPTADQQKNNKSDVQVTAEIRRAVVADKTLSTNGHNIKIITQDGAVTLKGPVHSDAEKASIVQKAVAVVGQANVTDQIEVKP